MKYLVELDKRRISNCLGLCCLGKRKIYRRVSTPTPKRNYQNNMTPQKDMTPQRDMTPSRPTSLILGRHKITTSTVVLGPLILFVTSSSGSSRYGLCKYFGLTFCPLTFVDLRFSVPGLICTSELKEDWPEGGKLKQGEMRYKEYFWSQSKIVLR